MLSTACRNSKYFKFYGTFNSNQNRLRMPCFFLSPSSHSSPYFWLFSKRATSMKLGMPLSKNIHQGGFSRNHVKIYFYVDFLSLWIFVLMFFWCLQFWAFNFYPEKYCIEKILYRILFENIMQFVHIVSHTCVSNDVKFFGVIFVFEGLTSLIR